ncbi:UNVERIFIED_CONTAM: hypothetical protein FKN15_013688 [Acipenser sinensis]
MSAPATTLLYSPAAQTFGSVRSAHTLWVFLRVRLTEKKKDGQEEQAAAAATAAAEAATATAGGPSQLVPMVLLVREGGPSLAGMLLQSPPEGPASSRITAGSAFPGVAVSPEWQQEVLWPEPHKGKLPDTNKGGRSWHHQAQEVTWSSAPFPLVAQTSLRYHLGSHLCLGLQLTGRLPALPTPHPRHLSPLSSGLGPAKRAPGYGQTLPQQWEKEDLPPWPPP